MTKGAQRYRILDLGRGDPDFRSPLALSRATARFISRGDTHYCDPSGLLLLRTRISRRLARHCTDKPVHHDRIFITAGATGALFTAISSLAHPGDTIVLPSPLWPGFREIAGNLGLHTSYYRIPDAEKDDREMALLAGLEDALGPQVKLVLINLPHNPCGIVLTRTLLAGLEGLSHRFPHIRFIFDETFYGIEFHGGPVLSALDSPYFVRSACIVRSFSKSLSACGYRAGFLVVPPDCLASVKNRVLAIGQCTATFIQSALANSLPVSSGLNRLVRICKKNRDLLFRVINAQPGLEALPVNGTFYMLIRITIPGMHSDEFTRRLFEQQRVLVHPGSLYGDGMDCLLRISFACPHRKIQEFCTRIKTFTDNLLQEQKDKRC